VAQCRLACTQFSDETGLLKKSGKLPRVVAKNLANVFDFEGFLKQYMHISKAFGVIL
jgi:hypothetical protein